MAKANKYYAVRKGRKPGIYDTWAKCQSLVSGYPNAEFKSFTSRKEAEDYVNGTAAAQPLQEKGIDELIAQQNSTTLIVFTDGSFDNHTKRYGYGVVLINHKRKILDTFCGADANPNYLSSRNVAGEIDGVKSAISKAIELGYSKVIIFYDYAGIEKWACGEWRTEKEVSKDYLAFIEEAEKKIAIQFQKVKAHSNIEFNEMADRLAKKSLSL